MDSHSDFMRYRIAACCVLVVVGSILSGCDSTVCSDCDGPTYTDAFRGGTATSNLDTLSADRSLVIQLKAVPNISGIGRLQFATVDPVAVRSPREDTLQSEEIFAVEVHFAEGKRTTQEIVLDPLTVDDNLSLHPQAIMDSVRVQDTLYGPEASEVRATIPNDFLNPEGDLGHILVHARRQQ